MSPDMFLWDLDETPTKADYNRQATTGPTAGTADYTTAPTAPSEYKWWEDGYCRGENPELFHPLETHKERPGIQARIRHIRETYCQHCKVRPQCLESALQMPSMYDTGVWGGFSERKRKELRVEYKRGTPVEVLIAKHDPAPAKEEAA